MPDVAAAAAAADDEYDNAASRIRRRRAGLASVASASQYTLLSLFNVSSNIPHVCLFGHALDIRKTKENTLLLGTERLTNYYNTKYIQRYI